ncbi:MAG: hypothetical protein H8D23_14095 [Candidatus Brocadiales bacterium]|nr:hypothetical protein [Candidatus Brocadiales bacterium]
MSSNIQYTHISSQPATPDVLAILRSKLQKGRTGYHDCPRAALRVISIKTRLTCPYVLLDTGRLAARPNTIFSITTKLSDASEHA